MDSMQCTRCTLYVGNVQRTYLGALLLCKLAPKRKGVILNGTRYEEGKKEERAEISNTTVVYFECVFMGKRKSFVDARC